jgi:hypothetical protein
MNLYDNMVSTGLLSSFNRINTLSRLLYLNFAYLLDMISVDLNQFLVLSWLLLGTVKSFFILNEINAKFESSSNTP